MTTKKKSSENIFYVRGVPEQLQKRFKLACVRNDRTMRDAIIDLMMKFCELDETATAPLGCDTGPESYRSVKFEGVKRQ